jgi:acetylornithine deacetylase/succinyl-diaminopimelate desuccinylase-like protein
MSSSEQARAYASEHRADFEQQLFDLLRIPSISAESQHKADMQRTAQWIAHEFQRIGVTRTEVLPTGGHPVVFAEYTGAGEGAKSVLVYGHYDVQPASLSDGWHSEPFEPTVRDGIVYARGSSDDKGQFFVHLKALESYLKTSGAAPINLKYLIEGEEEVGSPNLTAFIQANKDLLKADLCVISDTGSSTPDQPNIVMSVRGLSYMEIHVQASNIDLHSGGYGGVVHNPALALIQILSKMHDENNHILVPGFYEDVVPLSEQDRAELAKMPSSEEDLMRITGIPASWGEAGYTLRERVGARPTFEINGLLSGWTGEGSKTVLPAKAMAKISCRLVANQNPDRIYERVRNYVAQITPPSVRSEVKLLNKGEPALIPLDAPGMSAAARAYERGWGKSPMFVREGGSIPVVADFARELGLGAVMMGFCLNSDGAHGPDEHFSLDMFARGIQTAICFLEEVSSEG